MRSSAPQTCVCVSRQAGKSQSTATLAAHAAIFQPRSLILLVSPSQRQATELLTKVRNVLRHRALGTKLTQDAATSVELANGSRVVSLPSSPDAIRGYSAPTLIVEDEAAGSSCSARRPARQRFKVTAYDVPRIGKEWLEQERLEHGELSDRRRIRLQRTPSQIHGASMKPISLTPEQALGDTPPHPGLVEGDPDGLGRWFDPQNVRRPPALLTKIEHTPPEPAFYVVGVDLGNEVCSMVRVPSPEEEDAKRPHREREHLVQERTRYENRILALLATQDMRNF